MPLKQRTASSEAAYEALFLAAMLFKPIMLLSLTFYPFNSFLWFNFWVGQPFASKVGWTSPGIEPMTSQSWSNPLRPSGWSPNNIYFRASRSTGPSFAAAAAAFAAKATGTTTKSLARRVSWSAATLTAFGWIGAGLESGPGIFLPGGGATTTAPENLRTILGTICRMLWSVFEQYLFSQRC